MDSRWQRAKGTVICKAWGPGWANSKSSDGNCLSSAILMNVCLKEINIVAELVTSFCHSLHIFNHRKPTPQLWRRNKPSICKLWLGILDDGLEIPTEVKEFRLYGSLQGRITYSYYHPDHRIWHCVGEADPRLTRFLLIHLAKEGSLLTGGRTQWIGHMISLCEV